MVHNLPTALPYRIIIVTYVCKYARTQLAPFRDNPGYDPWDSVEIVGWRKKGWLYFMNSMGCSLLFVVAAALVIGFIPILGWMNMIVALPLSLIAMAATGFTACQSNAQPADKTAFWLAVALTATIILRIVVL